MERANEISIDDSIAWRGILRKWRGIEVKEKGGMNDSRVSDLLEEQCRNSYQFDSVCKHSETFDGKENDRVDGETNGSEVIE